MKMAIASLLSAGLFAPLALAGRTCQSALPARPTPVVGPYPFPSPHYVSPQRQAGKVCYVRAKGSGADDSHTLFSALKACNNGGTVYLPDAQYVIGKALDLTFLNAVDVIIAGDVQFTDDMDYWTGHAFQFPFQTISVMVLWGGFDVNMYGGGTIDGNGQTWWNQALVNTTLQRPIPFGFINLTSSTVSQLGMHNPPNWFNFISGSRDVLISDMNFTVTVDPSGAAAKNTDGWDTYRSDNIVIQNSVIQNTDDCVSFKPNSTNMVVQGLKCSGSHGISVGSLGQYPAEKDIVENIMVYNTTMTSCASAARIKVFQDAIPTNGVLPTNAGGGYGYVKNVTYDILVDNGCDYAIEVTQCYGTKNQTLCNQYPSKMIIEDILFNHFSGVASKKYAPTVGTLVCSDESVCPDIVAKNINITTPTGVEAKWTCKNVDKSLLEINCV